MQPPFVDGCYWVNSPPCQVQWNDGPGSYFSVDADDDLIRGLRFKFNQCVSYERSGHITIGTTPSRWHIGISGNKQPFCRDWSR